MMIDLYGDFFPRLFSSGGHTFIHLSAYLTVIMKKINSTLVLNNSANQNSSLVHQLYFLLELNFFQKITLTNLPKREEKSLIGLK